MSANKNQIVRTIVLVASMLLLSSCATISTVSQPAYERKPLVMSGSRLNIASLRGEYALQERFGVAPPQFPLLDLPFSVLLDFMVLGYALPVALINGR